MKGWVTTGRTESGDDLAILFWDCKPTQKQGDAAYKTIYPDEYSEVGFVNWSADTLQKVTV
jgi:hypothetical protein